MVSVIGCAYVYTVSKCPRLTLVLYLYEGNTKTMTLTFIQFLGPKDKVVSQRSICADWDKTKCCEIYIHTSHNRSIKEITMLFQKSTYFNVTQPAP